MGGRVPELRPARVPHPCCVYGTCQTANMAHIRQSRPDYGPGFKVEVLKPLQMQVPELRPARVPLPRGSQSKYFAEM